MPSAAGTTDFSIGSDGAAGAGAAEAAGVKLLERAEERLRRVPGLRMTSQRREILAVLLNSNDHPGATEIHQRAAQRLEGVSLATVYSFLDTLVEHGAIRLVNGDRHNARYCANMAEHAHFYCDGCGVVLDLPAQSDSALESSWKLPEGVRIASVDVAVRGLCSSCFQASQSSDVGPFDASFLIVFSCFFLLLRLFTFP